MSGRPPGKVRQMFEERRNAAESSGNTSPRHETTPVGWDKSYPLQPVGNASSGTGLYRRNSTARTGDRPNKYSGNYGPKARSNSVNRAVSMDRSRYAPSSESGYSSASVARTRSHHQLGNQSSGEDSYASSSRPQSRSGLPPVAENNNKYATFAGRSSFRSRNSYSIPDPDCSPPESRKTSYTHEYVRNLPPTATSTLPRGRLSRPNQHRDSMSSSYDQYSYSSQSSDKSDPQITASRSHHQLGPAYSMQSNTSLTQIPGPRSSSKSRLHSTSLR